MEVRIADEHDLTITTHPTETEDANLLLATLNLGPGPNRREVAHLASASGTQQ